MVETPEEFQALVEVYGPLYKHGHFKRGETIRYRVPGFAGIYSGEILWCQGPGIIAGHSLPMRYVTHCAERGFVDVVFTLDIVRDEPQ